MHSQTRIILRSERHGKQYKFIAHHKSTTHSTKDCIYKKKQEENKQSMKSKQKQADEINNLINSFNKTFNNDVGLYGHDMNQ